MRIMKKMIVILALALITSCTHDVNSTTGESVIEYTSIKGDPSGYVAPENWEKSAGSKSSSTKTINISSSTSSRLTVTVVESYTIRIVLAKTNSVSP